MQDCTGLDCDSSHAGAAPRPGMFVSCTPAGFHGGGCVCAPPPPAPPGATAAGAHQVVTVWRPLVYHVATGYLSGGAALFRLAADEVQQQVLHTLLVVGQQAIVGLLHHCEL